MTTTNVYLTRRARKRSGATVHYWTLRWSDSNGRAPCAKTIGVTS